MFEIECDMHYPPPISIEEELGEDECMDIRLRIEDYLKESGLTYFVVSSPSIDILMKIHNMKIKGVNIETTSAFSLN
jgi:hypothetical protein